MKIINKTLALAKKLGATVEVTHDCGHDEILVDAPSGKHWCEGAVHQLVYSQRQGPWKLTAGWKSIYERMQFGLEDCDVEHNDDCRDIAEGEA